MFLQYFTISTETAEIPWDLQWMQVIRATTTSLYRAFEQSNQTEHRINQNLLKFDPDSSLMCKKGTFIAITHYSQAYFSP